MKFLNLKLIAFVFVFVFLLSFVSAEIKYFENETSIGSGDSNITGQGIIVNTHNPDNIEININNSDGYININGNKLENIQPATKYQSATISIDGNGTIKSADFYTNENGSRYILGNKNFTAPPNSHIIFDDGKVKIILQKNSILKESDLPKTIGNSDPSLNDTSFTYILPDNIKLELPNGNILERGELVINGSKVYVRGDTLIDKISLNQGSYSVETRVFFDGQAHPDAGEDYISLNANTKDFHISSKGIGGFGNVIFKEDNPFVKVEKNGNFELSIFIGKPNDPNEFEMHMSNPEGKVPELDIKSLKGGVFIKNGDYVIHPNEVKVGENSKKYLEYSAIYTVSRNFSSSPVTINIREEDLLPRNKVIQIGKDNSYFILNKNNTLFEKISLSSYYESQTNEIKKELVEKIKEKSPGIKYSGIDLASPSELESYEKALSDMPDSLKRATNSVNFVDSITSWGGLVASGQADMGGEVDLTCSSLECQISTTSHEFAHDLHGLVRREDTTESLVFPINTINEILKENDKQIIFDSQLEENRVGKIILSSYAEDKIDGLPNKAKNEVKEIIDGYNQLKSIKGSKFDQEWINIQKGGWKFPIGYSSGSLSLNQTKWDGWDSGPRNGFVRPYGGVTLEEDIATFVGEINTNPSTFKPFVDPTKKTYDKRYVDKIKLLQKYGFITEEQLNNIISLG